MKSSIGQSNYFKSTGLKLVTALVFASLISSLSISPALAARDDGHGQNSRNDRHGQRMSHGDRRGHGYRPEYRQPYTYAQPVYVPPPVYYEEPRQSPGISIFFPLDIRR